MRKAVLKAILSAAFTLLSVIPYKAFSQKIITVHVAETKAVIQPSMWGIFFEDINLGADGGIYAELVKNRSFEFTKPMMGWQVVPGKNAADAVVVINRKTVDTNNPRFVRISVNNKRKGELGIINEGFRGMGIKKDLRYDFSMQYHVTEGSVKLDIGVMDSTGKILGETNITPAAGGDGWHKGTATFITNATELKAKMFLWFEGNGVIDIDMVSLFPADTWKNRPGGLRSDMVQLLADMKPGFIRFPGGCVVEGMDLENRYQWKKTVGPVDERKLMINRWNLEFPRRSTPDYFQTFGLGFFEYFQLAEDIGAEPLPILNCGMACQYNTAEVVQMDELDPYVKDALDLIEFANGDTTTTWGKVRASMGHPLPFHLKMMGVGNENWGPQYIERLKVISKAIKTAYPSFKIINSAGPDPSGERFDYLNKELRNMHADLIDEHYYRKPEWFFGNVSRYDNYPRDSSKVFAGEYASHAENAASPETKNNWLAALSEAAFMTGLERNADVVNMASYAPLFAHVDGWQWSPDLIWVNNLKAFGTPNYYVQKLFSLNKGNHTVPVTMNNAVINGQDSLYASAVTEDSSKVVIVKLVNASASTQAISFDLTGIKRIASPATFTFMQSNDLAAVNSLDAPFHISPKEIKVNGSKKNISVSILPYSFNVIRVKIN